MKQENYFEFYSFVHVISLSEICTSCKQHSLIFKSPKAVLCAKFVFILIRAFCEQLKQPMVFSNRCLCRHNIQKLSVQAFIQAAPSTICSNFAHETSLLFYYRGNLFAPPQERPFYRKNSFLFLLSQTGRICSIIFFRIAASKLLL